MVVVVVVVVVRVGLSGDDDGVLIRRLFGFVGCFAERFV